MLRQEEENRFDLLLKARKTEDDRLSQLVQLKLKEREERKQTIDKLQEDESKLRYQVN